MKGNINPEYLLEVRRLLGAWLRSFREDQNMTQEDVAEKMGMSRSSIAKIENGRWNFGIDTLTLFAIHLNFYQFFIPKDSDDPIAKSMRERWSKFRTDN
jgi:transcriptional regulator with XRE-family HTH domain